MQVQVRVSSACVTKNIYLIRVQWAAQVHWEVEVEVQLQVCRVFLQKKGISYMYTWQWKYNWQCKHNRLCKYKDKFVPCVSPTPYIQYKYNTVEHVCIVMNNIQEMYCTVTRVHRYCMYVVQYDVTYIHVDNTVQYCN